MNIDYEMLKYNRLIGLLIVSIASLTIWSIMKNFLLFDEKKLTFLVLISVVLIIYSSYKLINNFKFESLYFKYIIYIFFFYEFTIIIRGWSFSYIDLKTYIQSSITFWPFLIPLFVFFNKKISTMALLMKWIYYMGLAFLLISLIFSSLLLHRINAENTISIAAGCGFLMLNTYYLNNTKANITFIIILISLLSVTYLARRNVMLTHIEYIFFSYFLNRKYLTGKFLNKIFLFMLLCIVLYSLNPKIIPSGLSGNISQRLTEDTRSILFASFFIEMQDDLVLGKGMNGTYYFPIGGESDDGSVAFYETEYRDLIENGYLQLLLTGGIIHIILFLSVLVPALYLGIFRSSNNFSKACGIFVLLRLIDMTVYGIPSLDFNYILIWICVGVCYTSSIRELTNDSIISEFKNIGLL
jgi:hypothetical protein